MNLFTKQKWFRHGKQTCSWKWKALSCVQLFAPPWHSSWNSPGQNTGVGSCSLFQRVFQTQGLVTKGEMALEGRRDKLEVSHSDQFSSVAQSCLTLCNPMDCSMPGFPVHHQLLESAHTHVHWVGDAIQPSHPLSSPSLPAFNLSQHRDLFKWVSSSHQVAKVLEFQLQHQSFQWIFRTDIL